MRPACLPRSQREVHPEVPSRPPPRAAPRPAIRCGRARKYPAGRRPTSRFSARRSLARSLAGLLARTVRYLWIAIRGFIGIGRILRDTPARIVCALIICRLRRGIRAPRCHRWYRSSRPRIFTTLHLEKSRSACASILPVLFLPPRLPPPPPRAELALSFSALRLARRAFVPSSSRCYHSIARDIMTDTVPSQRERIFRLSIIHPRDIVFCGTRGFFFF